MTTITFEKDLKIKKSRFKDILDFGKYMEKHFYFTELKKAKKSEITPAIKKKMGETKKMQPSDFVNL